jgi:hypothetical protein
VVANFRHGSVNRPFPKGPLLTQVSGICRDPLAPEEVVPVETARVVIANYGALRHDFPQLSDPNLAMRYADIVCARCRLAPYPSKCVIDRWLIDNAAFVSAQQLYSNDVNAPIIHGQPVKRAFRPPHYGRAFILPVDLPQRHGSAALIDVKGIGVGPGRQPLQDVHGNGLEYLGVALADFFYGWLIDRIFARVAPGYATVPVYAVIDLGFNIVDGAYGTGPAGIHVRRAHTRTGYGVVPPMSGDHEERLALHMELLLRNFGVTSTTLAFSTGLALQSDEAVELRGNGRIAVESGRHRQRFEKLRVAIGDRRVNFVNFQMTSEMSWDRQEAQLVDLGHIDVRSTFGAPIATRVLDTFFNIGRLLLPEEPSYVQPDPALAIDAELFNRRIVTSIAMQYAQDVAIQRVHGGDCAHAIRRAIRRIQF